MPVSKIKLIFFLALISLSKAGIAFAQEFVSCGGPSQPSCEACQIFAFFEAVSYFVVVTVAPPIAVLAIMVYGLFLAIKGVQGSPEGVSKYKKALTNVIIGFLIIFLSGGGILWFSRIMGAEETDWIRIRTECIAN